MEKKKAPEGREQITLRLPAGFPDALKQEAHDRGMSLNAYIITLIYKARERPHQ